MTGKADFSPEEWELIREGPAAAGVIVLTASGGGTFRETWALAKTYAKAKEQHGESELLEALVGERPDLKRYSSRDELEQTGLGRLGEAVALLEQKATGEEVESYKRFVLDVANGVAEAHEEGGAEVSPEERQAIDKIAAILSPRAA